MHVLLPRAVSVGRGGQTLGTVRSGHRCTPSRDAVQRVQRHRGCRGILQIPNLRFLEWMKSTSAFIPYGNSLGSSMMVPLGRRPIAQPSSECKRIRGGLETAYNNALGLKGRNWLVCVAKTCFCNPPSRLRYWYPARRKPFSLIAVATSRRMASETCPRKQFQLDLQVWKLRATKRVTVRPVCGEKKATLASRHRAGVGGHRERIPPSQRWGQAEPVVQAVA